MKRFTLAAALSLTLVGSAVAGPAAIWRNYGVVTNFPNIDAVAFDNRGTIQPIPPAEESFWPAFSTIYDTQNTLYFTNSGVMSGSLGFRFDSLKRKGEMWTHRPAMVFTNSGAITGVDYGSFTLSLGSALSYYGSVASYVLVDATNVANTGTISVGDVGLIRLQGKNMDLRGGDLVAGSLLPENTSTLYYVNGRSINVNTNEYVNAAGVQDLYWGAGTNQMDVTTIATANPDGGWSAQTPAELVNWAGYGTNGMYVSLPISGYNPLTGTNGFSSNAVFQAWAYTNSFGTNNYVNIVFVRTNGLETNVLVDVRFNAIGYASLALGVTNYDRHAVEPIVRLGAVTMDVISGSILTNSIYVLDSGAGQNPIFLLTNYPTAQTMRPSSLEIATGMPYEWYYATNGNATFDPVMFYPGLNTPNFAFATPLVNYNYGAYGAQVSHSSQNVNGVYDNTGYNGYYGYYTNSVVLNNPSNGPARIEISANSLNLSDSRIRAEGYLSLKATNLVGTAGGAIDAGTYSCDLGSSSGSLSISNILPAVHVRAGGTVYAWSASWSNIETNDTTTNYYQFHVLVVDHALQVNQTPTIENLALRADNVYAQDTMRVTGSALFDAQNLTLNGPVTMLGDISSFGSANIPRLHNLLLDSQSSFYVQNELTLGYDMKNGLNSVTNRGLMEAAAVKIKATALENSGQIYTINNGSVWIDATTFNCVSNPVPVTYFDPISQTNIAVNIPAYVYSSRDIEIHSDVLRANGLIIDSGYTAGGLLTIYATNELSDGTMPTPADGGAIKNQWIVNNGFRLPLKPAVGDLFGTEISTTATNYQRIRHYWPADDRGRSVAGFTNNLAIGHLVLNRTAADSTLRFTGSGVKNAMYVDYLDFEGVAYDNYDKGLVIDPNLVIYFADSNVDPSKLETVYPGKMVWVPEFAGPNSSVSVSVHRDGVLTDMYVNRSLAQSWAIDSNNDGVPNKYDPFPLDGAFVTVNMNGLGSISPNRDGRALVVGQTYSISAVPSAGYLFAGWTWENGPADLIANASQPNITFVMQPNLVLTATFVPDPAVLQVSIDGFGKVTPDYGTRVLRFGQKYTITAVPAPGNIFVGWSGDVTSTARTISFGMSSNVVLKAEFATNNLPSYKGTYNGLFYVSNDGTTVNSSSSEDVDTDSSGAFQLVVSDHGTASGKLKMASGTYPFTTVFDQTGDAQAVVKRSGKPSLTVNLQLDPTSVTSGQIYGDVVNGEAWDAVVIADRVDNARGKSPAAGSYRFAIAGVSDSTLGPVGDAYGSISITSSGTVVGNGKLPDGTSFNWTTSVGQNGRIPVYYTRAGKDSVLGWVSCDTNDFSSMTGKVSWIKKAGATRAYPDGFSNTLDFIGSRFVAPAAHTTGLELRKPVVFVSGQSDYPVYFKGTSMTLVSSENNQVVSLTLSPNLGTFTGRLLNGLTGQQIPFSGVILQKQNVARGCFYSAGISGEVLLENRE